MKKYLCRFASLLPVIYPSFYTLTPHSSEELVFLSENGIVDSSETETEATEISGWTVDNTMREATGNHFHLFDKVGIAGRSMALDIGTAIAQNLLCKLARAFPEKKFIVYLTMNIEGATIVRFHQVWADEPPYYDATQPFDDGTELYVFRSTTGDDSLS